MTDTNNPDYLSGKFQHANKGQMSGEFHPNYNKIWMNDGNKQVSVKDEDKQSYLDKGWVIGTLQKGKTTLSSHVGSCWIHNNELQETKRISKSELDYYLSIGWKPNRLKLGKYGKKI
jgi:hypothetical protein